MNTTRQDAWSKDEDIMLAETVLRYIREGSTQLEAFKEVAKKLSRTSAACGFRWNATIRKKYHNAIQFAKEERKQGVFSSAESHVNIERMSGNDPIDTAILLLKKLKFSSSDQDEVRQHEQEETIKHLRKENEYLKGQLIRYNDAWIEMGKLWDWVKKENYNQ